MMWSCNFCGYTGTTGPVHLHPQLRVGLLCHFQAERKGAQ